MSSGVTPWRRAASVIARFDETGVLVPIWRNIREIFPIPPRQPGYLPRADPDADRREDGVVGRGQRAGQRVRARVAVLEVVDHELFVALRARDAEEALARGPHRTGPDALPQRLGQDERLDRRA